MTHSPLDMTEFVAIYFPVRVYNWNIYIKVRLYVAVYGLSNSIFDPVTKISRTLITWFSYSVSQDKFMILWFLQITMFRTVYKNSFYFLGFMIATQFFFTLCLIDVLISTVLVLVFFLCCGPDQRRFILIIRSIGCIMLAAGKKCLF